MAEEISASVRRLGVIAMLTGGLVEIVVCVVVAFATGVLVNRRLVLTAESRRGGSGLETGI